MTKLYGNTNCNMIFRFLYSEYICFAFVSSFRLLFFVAFVSLIVCFHLTRNVRLFHVFSQQSKENEKKIKTLTEFWLSKEITFTTKFYGIITIHSFVFFCLVFVLTTTAPKMLSTLPSPSVCEFLFNSKRKPQQINNEMHTKKQRHFSRAHLDVMNWKKSRWMQNCHIKANAKWKKWETKSRWEM